MKKSDVKELYSIATDKGVLVLIKRDVDKWLQGATEYSYTPDMLVNPKIKVLDNGVMKFSGLRLSFKKVRNLTHYDWVPKPLSELKDDWRDIIFYDEEDIIQKDVITWVGPFWPFRRPVKEKNVDHLKPLHYLCKDGYVDTQATSNYRLIGFKEIELNGVVK